MKTVNSNYVLGVMRLFNSEEYYMNATFALWVLRAVAGKSVECIDCKGRLYYDKQNPHYWIWKLTNDLIGRSWVSGYTFLLMGETPNWSISNRRTGSNVFYLMKKRGILLKSLIIKSKFKIYSSYESCLLTH